MLTRRTLLQTSALAALHRTASAAVPHPEPSPTLPDRANFRCPEFETNLNAGRWHPLSNGARAAVTQYHEYKQRGIWDHTSLDAPPDPAMHGGSQLQARALFAQLINASPDEIAFVQSTTAGENLVVKAMGLPQSGFNIVTDGLHFEGSLYLYDQLRRQGADIRIVKPRTTGDGWRIDNADLERAIDKNTRLVAVSWIASTNGFQHDLKSVSAMAHSHGALVYADLVQGAGAVPIDIRDSGVDFAASASYKWLQGDFGLGFLYAKQSVLRGLQRPVMSFMQIRNYETHLFPGDAPGPSEVSYEQLPTAAGYFQQGTQANAITETLAYSLAYIQRLGVANIQRHIQTHISRLRTEVPRLGHTLITPSNTTGPLISFQLKNPASVEAKLHAAKIDVSLGGDRMRVSPAVYTNTQDIDRLLTALEQTRS